MKRILISLLLAVSILLGTLAFSSCTVDGYNVGAIFIRGKNNYVALGDSIAAGVMLDGYGSGNTDEGYGPEGCFATLFGKAIGASNVVNLAVSGYKSGDIAAQVQTEQFKMVIDAEYTKTLSITVGSNDILTPSLEIVKAYLNIDDPDVEKENEMLLEHFRNESFFAIYSEFVNISKEFEKAEIKAQLDNAVAEFETNFATIMQTVRECNPELDIYVTGVYNPLAPLNAFEQLGITVGVSAQGYIDRINTCLKAGAAEYGYKFVDTTVIGTGETVTDENGNETSVSYTNIKVDISTSTYEFDPHPNATGHALIAKKLEEAYRG